jgi:nucleotide-binding universal stress UspA family protein
MSGCIVCGVDGSREAGRAAAVAARLARDLDRRTLLVNVDEEHGAAAGRVGIRTPWRGRRRKSLLKATAAECCFPPATELRLTRGDPTAELLGIARKEDAELVVVSTGGTGTASPVLLGGTASALMHRAPCPVVVVPASSVPPLEAESMRDVVCALEGRPSDVAALALATDLAARLGGDLHVVSGEDAVAADELGGRAAVHVLRLPPDEALKRVVHEERAGLAVVGPPDDAGAISRLGVRAAIALAADGEVPVVVLAAAAELQAGSGHYELAVASA